MSLNTHREIIPHRSLRINVYHSRARSLAVPNCDPQRSPWLFSARKGAGDAEKNLAGLADLSGRWIDRVHARRPPRGILLDMDSSVNPTHGEQEMSAWNGRTGITNAPAIIRCSCSTSSATWSAARCARAAPTAPMAGKAS